MQVQVELIPLCGAPLEVKARKNTQAVSVIREEVGMAEFF